MAFPGCAASDDARRNAVGKTKRGQVGKHDGAGADDSMGSDVDFMSEGGTDADAGELAYLDIAAGDDTGEQAGPRMEDAVVIEGRAGVDDAADAYAAVRIHDGAGEDEGTGSDFDIAGDDGCGVDQTDELELGARLVDGIVDLGARDVVADTEKEAIDTMLMGKGGQVGCFAEDSKAGDFAAFGDIGVRPADDFELVLAAGGVESDAAMAGGADEQDAGTGHFRQKRVMVSML